MKPRLGVLSIPSRGMNLSEELNQLKIDIALIKKDIRQIERFFNKVDETVDAMSGIAKDLAVQEQKNVNANQKIKFLDAKIDENTKSQLESRLVLADQLDDTRIEFRDALAKVSSVDEDGINEVFEKIQSLEDRVVDLERARWYGMGVAGTIIFVLGIISLDFLPFNG